MVQKEGIERMDDLSPFFSLRSRTPSLTHAEKDNPPLLRDGYEFRVRGKNGEETRLTGNTVLRLEPEDLVYIVAEDEPLYKRPAPIPVSLSRGGLTLISTAARSILGMSGHSSRVLTMPHPLDCLAGRSA